MPRIRQVQRNIKCTVATVNVFNITDRQVKTTAVFIAGTFPHDERGKSRLEKAVMKALPHDQKFLEILEYTSESKHYTMLEEDYIKYATVVSTSIKA